MGLKYLWDSNIVIYFQQNNFEKDEAELQDAVINSKVQAKEGEEAFQIHARHLYYHDVSDYYDFNIIINKLLPLSYFKKYRTLL